MFTEGQIRSYFAGIELIPHELTQFDVTSNNQRRKRSSCVTLLGGYTRVDVAADGIISVGIRGIPVSHQGHEIPIMGKNSSSEIAWQVSHCINTVTLDGQILLFEGSGLNIRISPGVYLGGSNRSLLGNPRGCAVSLNTVSALIAFSRMNEHAIRDLSDLASHKGAARSTFVSGKEEYDSLFPKSSQEYPWRRDNIPGFLADYPTLYLKRTNGWGLSLLS